MADVKIYQNKVEAKRNNQHPEAKLKLRYNNR